MMGQAMKDYLMAEASRIEMIKSRNHLIENLDYFDSDVKDQFEELKISHADKLKNIDTPDLEESSRRFYDECIKEIKNKKEIDGVKNVQGYYPKGRVHFNLEQNDDLSWKL